MGAGMKYRVTFYCPDRHITYDGGRQPDQTGVGGGVNARIRLSQSLAKRGHQVSMVCNCSRNEIHRQVHYIPLDEAKEIDTDILILSTSGDKQDLTPLFDMDVKTNLKILLIHGTAMPKGTLDISPDYFYSLSNFVRDLIVTDWKITDVHKIFVSYRGVIKEYFENDPVSSTSLRRDPFRLVYSGHPSKGRTTALEILGNLREFDPRYNLYVFGDERLWGGNTGRRIFTRNVRNFGTVPQARLARELLTCSFGIFIQARLEPFGQTLIEAMTAGCVPIASPVGSYQELVRHGRNGFFVEGTPDDPSTWKHAAELIHELQQDTRRLEIIRKNAMQSTMDWQEIVQAWEQHWDLVMGNASQDQYFAAHACPDCTGDLLHLADGYHCTACGRYHKEL